MLVVDFVPLGTENHPLAFRHAGSGPRPIVFVHGFSQSSLFWEPTLQNLPDGFAGYAVDLPGFGDSASRAGPYTINTHAAAVEAFMEHHGLTGVTLVANSMGGVVCQAVATQYPARLAKLVLVSSGSYAKDPAGANAAADGHAANAWDYQTASAYVSRFFVKPPADLEPFIQAALKSSRQARVETTRSSAATDHRPDLPGIKIPVLVVQGSEDRGRTPEDGRVIAGLVQHGRCLVIDGVGHTPMLEAPDEWQRIFREFLSI